MTGYLRPVDPTNGRICTYYTHTRRTTPSSEAGVDYYCPIGTPIRAAGDGVIFAVDGGIGPATGRYVTLDLYDGRRVRYLHLSRWSTYRGAHVRRGQIIGYSGASGYGSEYFGASSEARIPANTGGPHVHTTLWARHMYQFGRYPIQPTLDFEAYVGGGSTAGGGSTPINPVALLEETMGTNPIINVVDFNGRGPEYGTIWIGQDNGEFVELTAPFANNIRGVISVAFLGGKGDDLLGKVTLTSEDFSAVRDIWRKMCTGRTDVNAVWAEKIQPIDPATGVPIPGVEYTAEGFIASTNAQVGAIKKKLGA